ncbi:hypothetical protein SAMN04488074_1238 [Lentzea albidocapillata subsp. violacea]|uniref:Uncharacterized protein n=1 Tax=Lentzea albidocapillata subsp. violacea TaxID=128104 RepID=A0A1G9U1D1_9PSEU|nr:hypothetical protein [Lentzea albidocapillata]SDM53345.1 hypothetical protein SAMN04488074_1238 [Lentzea albidocapillata subsp. violacea]
MTDPLAPVSGQFALAGSTGTIDAGAMPSPDGVRPWGLRRAHPARPVPVSGEPTALTTSSVDGEDPPSAEDWIND